MLTGSSGCRPWVSWMTTASASPVSYFFLSSIYFCFLPALSLLLASLIILFFFFFVKYHLGFITGEKEAINYTLCCPMWWNEQQPCTDQLLTCFKEWSKLVTDDSSVQLLSHIWLFATPWTAAHQASLYITNSWRLLKLCPLSWWCHPTISSSVVPFTSCLQSFPASGSFQMSQFFASGGQKYWEFQLQHQSFPWIFRTDFLYNGLAGSPCCPRDSQVFSNTIVQKHQLILQHSAFCITQLSTLMTTGKTIALTRQTFVDCVHATSQWSAD